MIGHYGNTRKRTRRNRRSEGIYAFRHSLCEGVVASFSDVNQGGSMATRYPDTVVDKFILQVFKAVVKVPYRHNGKTIQPHKLVVSPLIARMTTCPAHCGACCEKFSLDYLPQPSEKHPGNLAPRQIELNGKSYTIWSDLQSDIQKRDCKYLSKKDARCLIYDKCLYHAILS